jgi:hypothetical protein
VTGTHAGDVHLGNAFLTDEAHPETLDRSAGANLTNLQGRCSTSLYLGAHSDIVALLVLEHQVRMQNLIARLNFEAREALGVGVQNPESSPRSSEAARARVRRQIAKTTEALLEYMLFRDEEPLKGPIRGTSAFTDDFQRAGPRDSKGRSLRMLDLEKRLLRFPCSYLIYSDAFEALPAAAQEYLWQRLEEILTGKDTAGAYAGMPAVDRQAVFEILLETKPSFAQWMQCHRSDILRSPRDTLHQRSLPQPSPIRWPRAAVLPHF